MVRKVLTGLACGAALFASVGTASAAKSLTIGTAAAPESVWGQAFSEWKKNVEKDGKGAVTIDVKFGSTQGTESTMVDKIKAGQLSGAAVTSVGLSKINKNLLAMQVPGVMTDWSKVDKVRGAMSTEFEKMLSDNGITLVTWGDVGYAHFLSKGFAVHTPDDLKGKNPWVYGDDPVLKSVYNKIGGVNPFSSELMAVGSNIDNGKINCMSISALAAEMLQWNSKFDNGVEAVNGIVVGAVVLSSDALNQLPADVKSVVISYGKSLNYKGSSLSARIRAEDAAAWARFKGRSGVKMYTPTDDDKTKWKGVFKGARDALKAGTFNASLVGRIESTAGI
jgi:TRAP-type C4-dicarboxylate transport system substrate-binding protein